MTEKSDFTSQIFVVFAIFLRTVNTTKMVVIIVHGGAANSKLATFESKLNGCVLAAKKGYLQLKANQSALDAVVEAAVSLEDDPSFNAGFGSSLTIDGKLNDQDGKRFETIRMILFKLCS